MIEHYEILWNLCEELHQQLSSDDPSSSIIQELILKVNLYQTILQKTDIPEKERQEVKTRTFGEILLTLTNLSRREDVNVFEALGLAYQARKS